MNINKIIRPNVCDFPTNHHASARKGERTASPPKAPLTFRLTHGLAVFETCNRIQNSADQTVPRLNIPISSQGSGK